MSNISEEIRTRLTTTIEALKAGGMPVSEAAAMCEATCGKLGVEYDPHGVKVVEKVYGARYNGGWYEVVDPAEIETAGVAVDVTPSDVAPAAVDPIDVSPVEVPITVVGPDTEITDVVPDAEPEAEAEPEPEPVNIDADGDGDDDNATVDVARSGRKRGGGASSAKKK